MESHLFCGHDVHGSPHARRGAEQDLNDATEQLSDAGLQNQALQASKRKLESEVSAMHVSDIWKLCLVVSSHRNMFYVD